MTGGKGGIFDCSYYNNTKSKVTNCKIEMVWLMTHMDSQEEYSVDGENTTKSIMIDCETSSQLPACLW
jgi:hypothetical protein